MVSSPFNVRPTNTVEPSEPILAPTDDVKKTTPAVHGNKKVLVLHSTLGHHQVQTAQRAFTILKAHGIDFETIDGADPQERLRYVVSSPTKKTSRTESLDRTSRIPSSHTLESSFPHLFIPLISRNDLFRISGTRGQYPLFFRTHTTSDGFDKVDYLGDWDFLEGVNNASSLPSEVLEANPNIITWDKILQA